MYYIHEIKATPNPPSIILGDNLHCSKDLHWRKTLNSQLHLSPCGRSVLGIKVHPGSLSEGTFRDFVVFSSRHRVVGLSVGGLHVALRPHVRRGTPHDGLGARSPLAAALHEVVVHLVHVVPVVAGRRRSHAAAWSTVTHVLLFEAL